MCADVRHCQVFCNRQGFNIYHGKKIKGSKGIFCQNKDIFRDWSKIKEFNKVISCKLNERPDACNVMLAHVEMASSLREAELACLAQWIDTQLINLMN